MGNDSGYPESEKDGRVNNGEADHRDSTRSIAGRRINARVVRHAAQLLLADTAFKGVSANTVGLGITLISQLLTVPIFLRSVGVQQYATWLVLTAFSTYLSLGNAGFAAAAGTKAIGLVALGLPQRAGQVIRSVWAAL
jgi:hypothetical protein